MIREPFQRIPNRSSIDRTGSDTTESVPKIEGVKRLGLAGADPAQSGQDRAKTQHQPRSDSIDQITFKRHEPGFQSDE